MRAILISILILAGCAKNGPGPDTQSHMRTGCSESGQAAVSFLEWGNEQALTYTCPKISGTLSCALAQSSDHSQAICETVISSSPPGMPNDKCQGYSEGLHHYLDTDSYEAAGAFDCGESYFSGLRCFVFSSLDVGGHSEMICLDNDL